MTVYCDPTSSDGAERGLPGHAARHSTAAVRGC
jgi:hypothetical protein